MAETHSHHDYAAANAKHFSERAESYRSELALEMAKRSEAAIRRKFQFNPEETEVLDFACGPGLVAIRLVPDAKRVVGADSAQGMVDVFNRSGQENGLLADKFHCFYVQNLKDESSPLKGHQFDLIFCVLAYHHFEDPTEITKSLFEHLKPKGRLLVIDFMDDEGIEKLFAHKTHHHIVAHKHGFSNERMTTILQSGGFANIEIEKAYQMTKTEIKSFQGHEAFGPAMEDPSDFTVNLLIASAERV